MLYAHQQKFLKENPNKSALVWSCGTGKTRTAIEWAKKDSDWGNTLIICPKALRTNWIREAERWGMDYREYAVLTKEEFRKEKLHLWPKAPGQLIIDEVHNGFLTPHFKSQMSKALRDYIKKHDVQRVLLLSATVYTSSPWNIYNLAYYCGHKFDWMKFSYKFFNQVNMGARRVFLPKKGCEKDLAELTKQFASVVALEDCVDVPEQTSETEYFELTKEQERLIGENYDPLPIVRFTKHHEISNGVLRGNEFVGDIKNIPCLKNDRILSLVEENKKIIIVCRYNLQIDALAELLKVHNPLIIRGDVKDRDAVCQQAEKADRAVVLVQAACSMGYELPSFRVMVFASMDFSFVNYVQMRGRNLRINNLQKNTYIHLLSGEMDEAVMEALENKKDFDIELYAKAK